MSTDPKDPILPGGAEDDLEALFADARAKAPTPSPDLLARIAAQAFAEQPSPRSEAASGRFVATGDQPRGWFGRRFGDLSLGFGGWSSLGGLTAALVVGFGLGLNPPDGLASLTETVLGIDGAELEDVFWGVETEFLEGDA